MGNCLCYDQAQERNKAVIRVITYNGDVLEFKGSTKAKNVTSGPYSSGYNLVHRSRPFLALPPKAKLKAGELDYLVPDLARAFVSQKSRQKIKIVVTKEELELLLGRSKQFQISRDIVVGHVVDLSCDDNESIGGSPKWRPSLSSIAEVKDF